MISFPEIIIYFFIYSIAGYFCEVIYCSIPEGKLINRGFLYGPYCPLYGTGSLLILIFLSPLAYSPVLLFFTSIIITSILEYFTGYMLEKMFNLKWWDYTNNKFNIHGRVCLLNSTLFGVLALLFTYFIHPVFSDVIGPINASVKRSFSTVIIWVLLIDLLATVNSLTNLEKSLLELEKALGSLKIAGTKYLESINLNFSIKENLEKLRLKAAEKNDVRVLQDIKTFEKLTNKDNTSFSLLKRYPNITHNKLNETLNTLKDTLQNKISDLNENIQNKVIDFSNTFTITTNSIVTDFNFYKLFWIFLAGSGVGYLIQYIYSFITKATVQSVNVLIFTPINPLFGIATIIAVLLLHKIADKRDGVIFIFSALIGGFFETIVKTLQVIILNIDYKQYSQGTLPIFNGRTSIFTMMFWGFLGVIAIKEIYPRIVKYIERIPNLFGHIFIWFISIVLIFDISISSFAVYRWSKRLNNISPRNKLESFFDEEFNNEEMETIYPNIIIKVD